MSVLFVEFEKINKSSFFRLNCHAKQRRIEKGLVSLNQSGQRVLISRCFPPINAFQSGLLCKDDLFVSAYHFSEWDSLPYIYQSSKQGQITIWWKRESVQTEQMLYLPVGL